MAFFIWTSPFCTVLPAAASPVLLTEATAESADAHVTLDVMFAYYLHQR